MLVLQNECFKFNNVHPLTDEHNTFTKERMEINALRRKFVPKKSYQTLLMCSSFLFGRYCVQFSANSKEMRIHSQNEQKKTENEWIFFFLEANKWWISAMLSIIWINIIDEQTRWVRLHKHKAKTKHGFFLLCAKWIQS